MEDEVSDGPELLSWPSLRLRYTATTGGHLLDDRPGKLPTGAAVAGYPFCSYLTYSAAFHALTAAQQDAVRDILPVHRAGADEPVTGPGTSQSSHGYGRNGTGVTRDLFMAFGIEES